MDKKEFHRQKGEIERSEAKNLSAKIITTLIPGGSTVYEAFTALVKPLHKERKDEWLYILMNDLVRREENGLTSLEKLSKNEEFVTIVTKATLLAQQNHQKEKIEALKNIVLNSTDWLSKGEPIFDWSHKFLMIVDEISPLHILLLKTFKNPEKVAEDSKYDFKRELKISSYSFFGKAYPELKERGALILQCWRELYNYGFVTDDDLKKSKQHRLKYISLTTDFGNKFLDMIENE